MIVNKQLSQEARTVIDELKRAAKGGKIRTEVTAISLSGGYVWGAVFAYFDDEGTRVAEETYYTMKGATRRVSGFVVLFDEKGNAFDGEMQNFFLSEKSKTISDFILSIIWEDLTPSILTMLHTGLEESEVCEIGEKGVDAEEGNGIRGKDEHPCDECEGDENDCADCECYLCPVACNETVRLKCDSDPFVDDDEDDEDDEVDEAT